MKKVISILTAALIVFAAAVPGFAAERNRLRDCAVNSVCTLSAQCRARLRDGTGAQNGNGVCDGTGASAGRHGSGNQGKNCKK